MNYKDITNNTSGIYKITSKSGRIYIGQSKDIKSRFRYYQLYTDKTQSQPKLYHSFMKHGIENHKFEIIHICDFNELNNLERYYQELYNCVNKGLNCMYNSSDNKPAVFSEETLIKKSLAIKGDKHPNWGKSLSEETKEKIRQGNKGKVIPQHVRDRLSKQKKGKPMPKGCNKSGLDNHKSIKIKSYNIITNEFFIMNLADTLRYFKCDRELIINRAKEISGVKTFRKHKDWRFEII